MVGTSRDARQPPFKETLRAHNTAVAVYGSSILVCERGILRSDAGRHHLPDDDDDAIVGE